MATIYLSVEDMKTIMVLPPSTDEFAQAWVDVIEHGFLFNEFKISVATLQQYYKVSIDGKGDDQKIHIRKIQSDDYGLPIKTSRYDVVIVDYLQELTKLLKTASDANTAMEAYAKSNKDFLDIVLPMALIQYVSWKSRLRQVEFIEPKIRTPKEDSSQKKSTGKSSKKQFYSLLECIKIYSKRNKNKGYTYHVESFPRRGGVRHLKNGKVVPYRATTVNPKNKGTDKNNNTKYTL